jgi:hypothetical protein
VEEQCGQERRLLTEYDSGTSAFSAYVSTLNRRIGTSREKRTNSCAVALMRPESNPNRFVLRSKRMSLSTGAELLPCLIALTAFVQRDDAQSALSAGFQVHLPKPVDPHELTSVIARLARRTDEWIDSNCGRAPAVEPRTPRVIVGRYDWTANCGSRLTCAAIASALRDRAIRLLVFANPLRHRRRSGLNEPQCHNGERDHAPSQRWFTAGGCNC